jgi:hypothetical protein
MTDTEFLTELKRRSSRLNLTAVWQILRTVRDTAPEAFQVFTEKPGASDQNLRKQYHRRNKPRLDAESYASFLFDLHCWYWRREVPGANHLVLIAGQARALRLHRKWKDLGFNREQWLGEQKATRERMGLGKLTRTEFDRMERLYDSSSKSGLAFRELVTRILTGGEGLSLTPFEAEELEAFAREYGGRYKGRK